MAICSDQPKTQLSTKPRMNLVIVGHVDHGKSTVLGRLLAETSSLHQGRLAQIRERCEKNGKTFEYAFLLDALADEQAQGITIEAARVFFETEKRRYIVLDAPGHVEFLRNMVTGASHAEVAVLVVDASEGVRENSRRHAHLLSLLGVKDTIVLINKMDLVDFSQEVFTRIVQELQGFFKQLELEPPRCFIPVSGCQGDNVVINSERMSWYSGPTLLASLNQLEDGVGVGEAPCRLYVQDVYKFTKFGDNRRVVAGTIASGRIGVGDELVFYPSGKKSAVKSFECFNQEPITEAFAGQPVAFSLSEQIYLARSELAAKADDEISPQVTTRMKASVFWLGLEPLVKEKDYILKIGTAKVSVRVEEINRTLDAADLTVKEQPSQVEKNTVADCTLRLHRAIAFDPSDILQQTSRFVLVDGYRISGGGIIRQALSDEQSRAREQTLHRNRRWINGAVSVIEREERYQQKPLLLILTGENSEARKSLGRAVEARLFREGAIVYYMGIGNILHGLDLDIEGKEGVGQEHIRRLAEVAHIMLSAGLLFIVSAAELSQKDLLLLSTVSGSEAIRTVWIGKGVTTDLKYDLFLSEGQELELAVTQVREMLYVEQVLIGR